MFSVSQTILKSIILISAGMFQLVLATAALGAPPVKTGEIVTGTLNVRLKPGLQARIIRVLNKGTRVTILQQKDGWLKISHRGKVGYVKDRERYIRILSGKEIHPSFHDPLNRFLDSRKGTDQRQIEMEAEDIQREIESSKAEIIAFTIKETEVIDNLNEIDRSLSDARRQSKSSRAKLADLSNLIQKSEDKIGTLNEKIRVSEDYASKRIVALYKLSWLGKTQVLTSTESIHDIFLRQRALEHILDSDEDTLQHLWIDMRQLQDLVEKQTAQIDRKRRIEAQLEEKTKQLSQKKAARSTILASIRTKKSLEMAAIDSLSQAATALDEKMKSFSIEIEEPVFVDREQPNVIASQKPFSSSKGLLILPVKGKIANTFGPYTDDEFKVKNFRSGIDIRADRGEPVRAVSGGTVLYASWFKGFGNMIIIDHGEHYYSVYAHIEELFKSKDDVVETGEVVATVGDTGSRTGAKLYFEIRHHGKAIDPFFWIHKG